MISKLRPFYSIGILILGISLFFTSCEKNDEITENNQSELLIKKINDSSLNSTIRDVLSRYSNDPSTQSRSSNTTESLFDFNVITEQAKYVEKGEYHSYTFPIVRHNPDENIQENLLLDLQPDGTYKEYLVRYYIGQDEFEQIENNQADIHNVQVEFIPIEDNSNIVYNRGSGGCQMTYDIVIELSFNEDCTCMFAAVSMENLQFIGDCDGGGGGGSLGGGLNTGGGSGNFGSQSPSDTTITSPVHIDGSSAAASILTNFLQPELTTAQSRWINNPNNADAVQSLFNYLQDNESSAEARSFTLQMIDVISQDNTVTDLNTLRFVLEAKNQDKIYNDLDSNFLLSVNQYTDIDVTTDPNLASYLSLYFSVKCATLRLNNPDWSDMKIYWEASKDLVHITLDVFGLVPVVGEVADLTNGVLYLIEGDGINASFSFAATIPIAGWASIGSKYAIKIIESGGNIAYTVNSKVRLTWKVLADGTIHFGSDNTCRRQLRKVLGLATGVAQHAHHIIPLTFKNHSVVQKAAKSSSAFHMNELLNGIPIPSSNHLTGHSHYNDVLEDILDGFNPSANVDEAYDFLSGLTNHIRDLITNNPTLNLGQIGDLISYP